MNHFKAHLTTLPFLSVYTWKLKALLGNEACNEASGGSGCVEKLDCNRINVGIVFLKCGAVNKHSRIPEDETDS